MSLKGIVLLAILPAILSQTLGDNDNLVDYANGSPRGAYIVQYDAADENIVQCSGNASHASFIIYKDGIAFAPCDYGTGISTTRWNDTEGTIHTILFDAPQGAAYTFRLAGRHIPTRGDDLYGELHHWSWYPKIVYGTTFQLSEVYNDIVSGLVNQTLGFYLAMGLFMFMVGTIVRMMRYVSAGKSKIKQVGVKGNKAARGARGGSSRGTGATASATNNKEAS